MPGSCRYYEYEVITGFYQNFTFDFTVRFLCMQFLSYDHCAQKN